MEKARQKKANEDSSKIVEINMAEPEVNARDNLDITLCNPIMPTREISFK